MENRKKTKDIKNFTTVKCKQRFKIRAPCWFPSQSQKVNCANITFQIHEKTHTDAPGEICDQCGKAFYTRQSVKNHMLSHTKPWKCEICGRGFMNDRL